MHEQFSPDELQALASKIADRIVSDPSLADSVASRLASNLVCAPGKLCCFLGYNCDSPFTCSRDFRCPQGFASQLRDITL